MEIFVLIKDCVVIGCGKHAHAVISIIESSNEKYNIIGLIDTNSVHDLNEHKNGYSVISNFNDFSQCSNNKNIHCFIAIGDNKLRKEYYEQLKGKGFKLPNLIARTAIVDRTVSMGDANILSHFSLINSNSKVGSNNLINSNAIIEHDCILGSHNHTSVGAILCGSVKLNDLTMVGAGCRILPNLEVSSCVTIGAGAIVTKDIFEEQTTFVGLPARRC
ncbi:acetyltransferase [Vibrio astriarenae]